MNCKAGDLAIIVRSNANNAGKIVEVISLLGTRYEWEGRRYNLPSPAWMVRTSGSPINTTFNKKFVEAPVLDAWMRPIRPGELDDETHDSRELEAV